MLTFLKRRQLPKSAGAAGLDGAELDLGYSKYNEFLMEMFRNNQEIEVPRLLVERVEGGLTLPVLPNHILRVILNLVYAQYFPDEERKILMLLDSSDRGSTVSQFLRRFSMISKRFENRVVPFLDYGLVKLRSTKEFVYFMKLKVRGVYKTPIGFKTLDLNLPIIESSAPYTIQKMLSPLLMPKKEKKTQSADESHGGEEMDERGQHPEFTTVIIHKSKPIQLDDAYLLEFLRKLRYTTLVFRCDTFKQHILTSIFLIKNLIKVDFSYQNYGSSVVDVLQFILIKKEPSLTYLNLSGNNILRSGGFQLSKYLLENGQLEYLNLSLNHLTDSISAISESIVNSNLNNTLQIFNICENSISDPDSTNSLAMLIQRNKSITNLDLSVNKLGDFIEFSNLIDSLTKNSTIKQLKLSDICIHYQFPANFGTFLKKTTSLKSLYFGSNSGIQANGASIMEDLSENKSLEHLNLDYSHFLSQPDIMESLIQVIKNHKTLKSLNLFNCISTATEHNYILTESLVDNRTLTDLDLSINVLSDIEGVYISKFLKMNINLKKLKLGGNFLKKSAVDILNTAIDHPTLAYLNLSNNDFGALIPKNLVFQLLTRNKTLHFLNLSLCNINDEIGSEFAAFLPFNLTLSHLDLSKNYLNSVSGKIFSRSLAECSHRLHYLNLSNNMYDFFQQIKPSDINLFKNQIELREKYLNK